MELLTVDRLTKKFGGLVANNAITLHVDTGEIVSIIGPNGAGKSTFFNCLVGALRPTSGRIAFAGHDIAGAKPEHIAVLGMARTFQIPRSFRQMTVLENTMVGALLRHPRLADARDAALEVLEHVGLAKRADVRAGDLNVAGQKRVELARALATSPKLLLLDEVAGGLNPTEALELADILQAIHAQGVSLLIVEHVLEVVMRLAQRVVVFNFGAVLTQGTPAEIVNHPAVIEAYLGRRKYA